MLAPRKIGTIGGKLGVQHNSQLYSNLWPLLAFEWTFQAQNIQTSHEDDLVRKVAISTSRLSMPQLFTGIGW